MQTIKWYRLVGMILAVLFVLLLPCACFAGPFGLEAGMSKEEVIQKIGKDAIVDDRGDNIFFSSAPTRSIYFEEYQCSFDLNNKLWAVSATSKPLTTKSQGDDLRDMFDNLQSALENKYGKVLYVTGSRKSGVKWADSVANNYPFTEAVWDGSSDYSRSSHIDKIVLQVTAWDTTHGFIQLKYTFTTLVEGPL